MVLMYLLAVGYVHWILFGVILSGQTQTPELVHRGFWILCALLGWLFFSGNNPF